jgi:alkanesulfonate monooxygenase SsuD/methylene tetrahydromethanopterin reductase-like flavin-dependent oxidoreductase (luciferase family)
MLGMPIIVAETEAEAKYLSTTSHQRILALLRGDPLWLKPPVENMHSLWSPTEEFNVNDFLGLAAVGNPEQIKIKLEKLVDELNINEFMFTNDVYDPNKRIQALELLANIKTC